MRRRERLDFVNLRAPDGSLRATHEGGGGGHDPTSPAYKASATGGEHVSVEVLSAAQLSILGPGLLPRVPVPLVPNALTASNAMPANGPDQRTT